MAAIDRIANSFCNHGSSEVPSGVTARRTDCPNTREST